MNLKFMRKERVNQTALGNASDNLIQFKDLGYVYNPKSPYEFTALRNINLTITDNHIIGVIGSTGSGKSTLVQHLNGLIIPSTGSIETHGFMINANQRKIPHVKMLRKRVGLVFQFPEYQLFEETVKKDIMFGPVQLGESKAVAAVRTDKYMQLVGMSLDLLGRSPFSLSGGQKRRVALAGILAMEGDTLVVDEPTAGLDPNGEKEFINLFRRLNTENKRRIVLVSHNMDHILEICKTVVVLHEGKVVAIDTPSNVFANEELTQKLNIYPPQIYNLLHELQTAGIDIPSTNISDIDSLVQAIVDKIKAKKGGK